MKKEEIIQLLTEAAAHPARTVKETCQKTGKRAVGCVPPYVPEELIQAAGCIPVGLWGGQVELRRVRTYLPAFACSIMQSIVELAASGAYDDLAAVVTPSPCDTLKCIGQKWKGKAPCIQFTHPMNRRLDCAKEYLVSEYRLIQNKLEAILDHPISEEAVSESILLYNRYRSVMRTFTMVAADYPQTITPTVRHSILKAAWFMDKEFYTSLVENLTHELRKGRPEAWDGKRVVLSGITFEPEELLKILEFYHLSVAGDDLAQESRQFRTDAPWARTPLESLAMQWQEREGCSLAFDPYKGRVRLLLDIARSTKADGLILGLMKFCDPEEYDVPILMEAFKEARIPLLVVEIDQQTRAYEQIMTRIQSFAETL